MRSRTLLAGLLLLGAAPGCVRVTEQSEVERLADRLRDEERARSTALAVMEGRLRKLEARNAYLEGYLQGALGGGGSPAASGGAAPRPGQGQAASAPAPFLPMAAGGDADDGVQAERYGGTYRQALATDPPKLDPAFLEDSTSHRVGAQILEGLVEFDGELQVVPCIAKDWDISEDGLEYTFRLHEGVKFHHGEVVTAEDFRYSFGRILDPRTASVRTWLFDQVLGYPLFSAYRRVGDAARAQAAGKPPGDPIDEHLEMLAGATKGELARRGHPAPEAMADLARRLQNWAHKGDGDAAELAAEVDVLSSWDFLTRGLDVVDEHTFRIRLARPFAPFLSLLAMVNAAVVPKSEVERLGDDFAVHPVGTGPFRFVSWDRDVRIRLEAFDGYFRGRPYLDALEFRIIPDSVTRLTEFEVGNLESENEVPDEKYDAIKADPSFPGVLEEKPLLHVFYLGMNRNKPPFDDVRVRKAFNHVVNKQAILDKIRKGRGQIAHGPLPPGLPAYDPDLEGYEYDPDKAIALLKEAGYDPPSKLGKVDFWFNSSTGNDVNAKIAEVFQENLKQIGVELELNSVDWGTYLQKVNRCEPSVLRMAWLADYPDADNFMYVLFHSSTVGQANAACYENDAVDSLLEQARESSDREHRTRLYRQAQRLVVEDAIWVPVFHMTGPFLRKPYVKGAIFPARGADAIRYKNVWLDKDEMAKAGAGR